MDTLSKLHLEAMNLEDKIEQAINDGQPEFVPDYQEELDYILLKIKRLESKNRIAKKAPKNTLI